MERRRTISGCRLHCCLDAPIGVGSPLCVFGLLDLKRLLLVVVLWWAFVLLRLLRLLLHMMIISPFLRQLLRLLLYLLLWILRSHWALYDVALRLWFWLWLRLRLRLRFWGDLLRRGFPTFGRLIAR